jgi:serine/threonine-protein kinase
MAAESTTAFLDQLRESELLAPGQLEEISSLPEAQNADVRPLARRLFQRGWLTRYQINQIAQGRAKDLIIGPYVLLDRIGEGGMGQVFKARHRHMNRLVALKLIRKERLSNPAAVRRFFQEVQAAAHLSHPNIVIAFDAGLAGQTPFFAMEYVEGIDLGRLLKESGPLPVPQACDYIRQAAVGLQHAHERGLVHRDIKPHNLLVTRPTSSGETGTTTAGGGAVVKILDMGLARLQGPTDGESGVTKDGVVIGTPDYLAPEQAANARTVDIRSDLYSLGCTFYHLLTGRPPFRGTTVMEVLIQHQMEPPAPIEAMRSDVPPAVAQIVARLLLKKPEARFQTPAELAAALAPYCGDVAASPVPQFAAAPATDFSWTAVSGNDGKTTPIDGAPLAESSETTDEAAQDDLAAARKKRQEARRAARKRRWLIIGGTILHLTAIAILAVWLWPKGNTPKNDNKPEQPVEPPAVVEGTKPKIPLPQRPEPPANNDPNDAQPPDGVPETREEALRFAGHTGPIRSVSLSADGRTVISCGDAPATIRLWDAKTGKEILQFKGPTANATKVVLSPNGKLAISSGMEPQIRLWDTETGLEIPRLPRTEGFSNGGAAFAAAGQTILACVNNEVQSWELETAKPLARLVGHQGTVLSLAVATDGRRALTGGADKSARIWDLASGIELKRLEGHAGPVLGVAFSRDGRYAVSAGSDGTLRLWSVETGKELQSFRGHKGAVLSVAFAPDGLHIASGGNDKTVRLWEQESGKEVQRYVGHAGIVQAVVFTPDSGHVLSASSDATIRLWATGQAPPVVIKPVPPRTDVPPPPPAAKLAVPDEAKQAAAEKLIKDLFKDDYAKKAAADRLALANRLAKKARETKGDAAARFVLLGEAQDLAAQAGDVAGCFRTIDEMGQSFSIDGMAMKMAALGKAAASSTNLGVARIVVDQYLNLTDEIVSRDDYETAQRSLAEADALARKINNVVVIGRVETRSKTVRELQTKFEAVKEQAAKLRNKPADPEANLAMGRFVCFEKADWDRGLPMLAKGSNAALKALAQKELASPDTAAAEAELADAWADLAKAEQGSVKLQLQRHAYYWYQQAAPNLQGLAQATVQKRMKEFEALPGFKVPQPAGLVRRLEGHTDEIRAVAISADGRRAVSGGADKVPRLWDLNTGKELRQFDALAAEIRSVALSSDGRSAAAGSADGQVRLWEAATGRESRTFPNSSGSVDTLAFAPDGSAIVFGGMDKFFRMWPLDDLTRGSIGYKGSWGAITCMVVSPNNRFALFGTTDGLWLYGLETRTRTSPFLGNLSPVTSMALSPNGLLAFSGHADGTTRLWETTTGKPRPPFKGHSQRVLSVAFSRDGQRALSASADKTVRSWDLKLGISRELLRLDEHFGEITTAAISADGRLVLTGGTDKTGRLWRLP